MANPQIENGYTRIANELFDALYKIRIPGEARQVFDFIVRKTYGYGKKIDMISLGQIAEATGLKRPTVCRSVNTLIAMNLVFKDTVNGVNTFQINKDFDSWKVLSKKITVIKKDTRSVIENDNRGVIEKDTHNRKNTKKERNTVAQDATGPEPSRKKKDYDDPTPYSLSEFVATMRGSPQRHMRLVGEYADTKQPRFTTKGQWRAFVDRNVKAARILSPYTDEQIAEAYEKVERASKGPKGYITRWTLETLAKYLE